MGGGGAQGLAPGKSFCENGLAFDGLKTPFLWRIRHLKEQQITTNGRFS